MFAPVPKPRIWGPVDGNVYKLHSAPTGAAVDAFFIQANSELPIGGYWIIRLLDVQDARSLRREAPGEAGDNVDFILEWDDLRPRKRDVLHRAVTTASYGGANYRECLQLGSKVTNPFYARCP